MKEFLANQTPENSLHVRFDFVTGQALPNEDYPHLQLDCINLFLLSLVQMIASGLQVCAVGPGIDSILCCFVFLITDNIALWFSDIMRDIL